MVCLVGCGNSGPPLGLVEGTITLDGQPVEEAMVTFEPMNVGDSPSYSHQKTDAQGHYKMIYKVDHFGVIPGKHRVTISTYHAKMTNPISERIPLKYNVRSELEREVIDGRQTIDFELSTEGVPENEQPPSGGPAP